MRRREVGEMIARNDPKWAHYRPSRAGSKGLLLFLTPEEHAVLQEWAKAHGYSLANAGREALGEWMASRGIGGGEVVEQVERANAKRA